MIKAWRIVPERRAADAFVGEGARLYGGRWNLPGLAMVYCSEHKSLAALEQLVHFSPLLPNRLKSFPLNFPESLLETMALKNLPEDWRQEPPPPSTQQIGGRWIRELRSAVLAVPSILVPEEMNYLLNPAHPDFKKITIGKSSDFSFDGRLLA